MEGFLYEFWLLNLVLFAGLIAPALVIGGAGWPLRLAAAAGLVGAGVWEGVALRARRFPLWADVLETVAVLVVTLRYPTSPATLALILAFALPALGFRILYGSTRQTVARTAAMLGAIYAGSLLNPPIPPVTELRRLLPVLVAAGLAAALCGVLAHILRQHAVVAARRRIAAWLNADLVAASGRDDVHAALLRAVLDLLRGHTDVRVVVWDEPSGRQPTAVAGYQTDQARSVGERQLSVADWDSWSREALVAGESAYRESFDAEEAGQAVGCDPIPGVTFVVPLRHREEIRALTVASREPIPVPVRAEIENLARVAEIALGSIELTRASLDGLRERSYHDPLTGLGNRELLLFQLEQALAQPDRLVGLLRLRIDHFTTIDASLGNTAGDAALVALAGRLVNCVGAGATVARLGGDEFAILLAPLTDPSTAEQVAGCVLAALDQPLPGVPGRGSGVSVRGSIGVALSGPTASTPSDLLRNADIAMDTARTAGGGTYQVFEPEMRASIRDRLELESKLRGALERGELVVHYQPVVSLGTGRTVGVEALVRWNDPDRGTLPPDDFIPIAEASGLITDIGAWVLRAGCKQLNDWSANHPELAGLSLNVNLSAVQLAQADLPRTIARIVEEVGVDPKRIVLELTESALVDNTAANLDKLMALKAMGLRLAADDFGTGFSSLDYLRRFPFDIIKIDRSFVEGVEVDDGAAALVSAIIRMGHALGLICVAEGVETAGAADWLTAAGCHRAQGHHFATAMPPDQLLPLLTRSLPLAPRGH